MGKVYERIDDHVRAFIEGQQMFFVATAPLDSAGHVNVSPKGLDTLRILSPRTIAYLDYVGSGAETIAHLNENGRIVLMVCAFQGSPNIMRLYGRGEAQEPQDAEYQRLRPLFPESPSGRAIITIEIDRIADSCGFGVPLYQYERQRSHLLDWAGRKGEDGLRTYQSERNARSIDGLPALDWTRQPDPIRP